MAERAELRRLAVELILNDSSDEEHDDLMAQAMTAVVNHHQDGGR